MHLVAILGLPHPFEQLLKSDVEAGVLVGARRLSTHHRTGADQGELDPVIARRAVGFVVTDDANLESQRLIGEMSDLLGLLGGVILEPIGNLDSAAGDGDVHVRTLLLVATARAERGLAWRAFSSP